MRSLESSEMALFRPRGRLACHWVSNGRDPSEGSGPASFRCRFTPWRTGRRGGRAYGDRCSADPSGGRVAALFAPDSATVPPSRDRFCKELLCSLAPYAAGGLFGGVGLFSWRSRSLWSHHLSWSGFARCAASSRMCLALGVP